MADFVFTNIAGAGTGNPATIANWTQDGVAATRLPTVGDDVTQTAEITVAGTVTASNIVISLVNATTVNLVGSVSVNAEDEVQAGNVTGTLNVQAHPNGAVFGNISSNVIISDTGAGVSLGSVGGSITGNGGYEAVSATVITGSVDGNMGLTATSVGGSVSLSGEVAGCTISGSITGDLSIQSTTSGSSVTGNVGGSVSLSASESVDVGTEITINVGGTVGGTATVDRGVMFSATSVAGLVTLTRAELSGGMSGTFSGTATKGIKYLIGGSQVAFTNTAINNGYATITNLSAGNVKSGVTIAAVLGTLASGGSQHPTAAYSLTYTLS